MSENQIDHDRLFKELPETYLWVPTTLLIRPCSKSRFKILETEAKAQLGDEFTDHLVLKTPDVKLSPR